MFEQFFNILYDHKNLKRKSNFQAPPLKKIRINNIKINNNNININNKEKSYSQKTLNANFNQNNNSSNKNKLIQKVKNIMQLKDTELNSLPYQEALKLDNRSYCQYYLSILRTKHIFFFSFYLKNDYNSRAIKIFLFLFHFIIYYFVNALFFIDETMHKIYEDGGSFNFIYQLPQILYSALISGVINSLIRILAISENRIIEFKKIRTTRDLEKKRADMERCLYYKYIFYFIISFISTLFFWYYLACFCAIYQDTQIHLIKDTVISYGFSLLYPFGLYLIPGFFRIPSLSSRNKDYLYKLSRFIEIIL